MFLGTDSESRLDQLVKIVVEASPIPRGLVILALALLAWGILIVSGCLTWMAFWRISDAFFGPGVPLA